jgi:hypothetical protein
MLEEGRRRTSLTRLSQRGKINSLSKEEGRRFIGRGHAEVARWY